MIAFADRDSFLWVDNSLSPILFILRIKKFLEKVVGGFPFYETTKNGSSRKGVFELFQLTIDVFPYSIYQECSSNKSNLSLTKYVVIRLHAGLLIGLTCRRIIEVGQPVLSQHFSVSPITFSLFLKNKSDQLTNIRKVNVCLTG